MRTMREKIARAYILMAILIPGTIFVLFNAIVFQYKTIKAKEDLTYTVQKVAENLESTKVSMPDFMKLLKTGPSMGKIELVIYNVDKKFARFTGAPNNFVTPQIATAAYTTLDNVAADEMGIFRINGERYYVMEVRSDIISDAEKIIYITKGLMIDDFVAVVNILLVLVSSLVIFIAVLIIQKVARSIATPIEKITAMVEHMNPTEIIEIDVPADSVELFKLTSEINLLNKRIYDFQKSQKMFLQNASHQIRTPLMSIQGYSDGLEMGIFTDTAATVKLISKQVTKLSNLVNSLLMLARAENFKENEKFEKLSLSMFIEEMGTEYEVLAEQSGITLAVDAAEGVFVNGNSELLNGAIGNILSNALRYAKAAIEVSLTTIANEAIIIIKDDGDGIIEGVDVFERFVKGNDGNFGLGLSIAKTAAEALGGKIFADNDGGAKFTIILPK
ncbi:sensor histidine kinase [Candidatus Epulonipiscium viviparus]|uniref:sensor histidine kinase n=1 Tax=Candidatus Epulonipiscium viviparus TaxID=420336 RepID=UPI00016C030C|nr:HAMP domain-containing sensor histidine kinase [Candidatus Epulopiscium viviparus]